MINFASFISLFRPLGYPIKPRPGNEWENLVIFGIYNNTTTPDHTIKSRNRNDQSNLSFLL